LRRVTQAWAWPAIAAPVLMRLRRDTLADSPNGLVGTVGCIQAMPGATNVIPGQVRW